MISVCSTFAYFTFGMVGGASNGQAVRLDIYSARSSNTVQVKQLGNDHLKVSIREVIDPSKIHKTPESSCD